MTQLINKLANEKQLQRHLLSLSTSTHRPIDVDIPVLSQAIKNGTYHPTSLFRRVMISKKGKVRNLDISSYKDRIVEKRVLELITPYAEKIFHPCSYAYRKGIGTHDAIAELIDYRESGYLYVVKSDIEDCFPNIDQHAALSQVFPLLPDNSLNHLLAEMVCRMVTVTEAQGQRRRRQECTVGLPQGLALSPLLMNVYLTTFDNQMAKCGLNLIRYADDLVIPCKTEKEALNALTTTKELMEEIGMKLSETKTEIMSFEEGFTFLGEEFGCYYPPVEEDYIKPTIEKVLYAGKQGSRIRMKSGRIIIESEKSSKIADYPIKEISRIVVFGSVSISSGVRSHCMVNDIDLVFLSRKGNYIGEQTGINSGKKISRLKAQLIAAEDPNFSLELAKEMIISKIRHQRTIVQKFRRSYQAKNYLDMTERMIIGIEKADTIDEIRGYEGVCASQYFLALGQIEVGQVSIRREEICFWSF